MPEWPPGPGTPACATPCTGPWSWPAPRYLTTGPEPLRPGRAGWTGRPPTGACRPVNRQPANTVQSCKICKQTHITSRQRGGSPSDECQKVFARGARRRADRRAVDHGLGLATGQPSPAARTLRVLASAGHADGWGHVPGTWPGAGPALPPVCARTPGTRPPVPADRLPARRGRQRQRQRAPARAPGGPADPAGQERRARLHPGPAVSPGQDLGAGPRGALPQLQPQALPESEAIQVTRALVAQLPGRYPIDPQREYLLGFSAGSAGSWDLLTRSPGHPYAAAAMLSGAYDPSRAATVAALPLWFFHGEKDEVSPYATALETVQALRQAGGSPRYTLVEGGGHDTNEAAVQAGVYAWLLSQRRAAAPAPQTSTPLSRAPA